MHVAGVILTDHMRKLNLLVKRRGNEKSLIEGKMNLRTSRFDLEIPSQPRFYGRGKSRTECLKTGERLEIQCSGVHFAKGSSRPMNVTRSSESAGSKLSSIILTMNISAASWRA
jgi:hypothetical protein